jgi:hypothetical protein
VTQTRLWRCALDELAETIRGELARFGAPAGVGEVVERWPAAVGEAIARNAWPSRVGRDGTVHVNASDAIWAFELTQRAAEIARLLGVPAVRFAPGAVAGAPDAAAEPVRATSHPTLKQLVQAEEIAAAVESQELREAVEKAVALGLARSASDRAV